MGSLVARLAGLGAVSGVVAWIVALGTYRLFAAARPDARTLLLAIVLGAIIGTLLGVLLSGSSSRGNGA